MNEFIRLLLHIPHGITMLHRHNPWGFWVLAYFAVFGFFLLFGYPIWRFLYWFWGYAMLAWAVLLYALGVID